MATEYKYATQTYKNVKKKLDGLIIQDPRMEELKTKEKQLIVDLRQVRQEIREYTRHIVSINEDCQALDNAMKNIVQPILIKARKANTIEQANKLVSKEGIKSIISKIETIIPKPNGEGESDDKECKICSEFTACITFGPCGHTIACPKCAVIILKDNNKCPICRSNIETAFKIYE